MILLGKVINILITLYSKIIYLIVYYIMPDTIKELPKNVTVPSKYCVLMLDIIKVVSKRGSIEPSEFAVIGELVDFLNKELNNENGSKTDDVKSLN